MSEDTSHMFSSGNEINANKILGPTTQLSEKLGLLREKYEKARLNASIWAGGVILGSGMTAVNAEMHTKIGFIGGLLATTYSGARAVANALETSQTSQEIASLSAVEYQTEESNSKQ